MASSGDFFLAVNYPWLNYGRDFGRSPWGYNGIALAANRATVASDFRQISSSRVAVVRWFLLGDGRSGVRYEQGVPAGPDDLLFTDIAAVLDLAAQSGLRICFSLFDFLWLETPAAKRQPGAADFPGRNALQFAGGRQALLERVLIPIFREFRGHRALFAWEVVNEPEWAIREFQRSARATLPFAEAQAFFREIVEAAHSESAGVSVTLGSARLEWLRAWREIGLDLLQAHYYPGSEDLKRPLAAQLALATDSGKPLWLGELPARDPSRPDYSLEGALTACRKAGLAGAGIWRWRPPEAAGSDVALGSVEPERLSAWLSQSSEFRV